MTRAISRDSFDELKNYLGVYLQQGRAILDADWNENQDIVVSLLRRLVRESLGDGSPNDGFRISPPFAALTLPPVVSSGGSGSLQDAIGSIIGICLADLIAIMIELIFGSLPFFLQFPGFLLDDFEDVNGWALNSAIGRLRLGRDRPFRGRSFVRVSGHPGSVQLIKTLPALVDLSSYELATFRYRLNEETPGDFTFFLIDDAGNRSVWKNSHAAIGKDQWNAGLAAPLNLAFHIVTTDLVPGNVGQSYSGSNSLSTFGGTLPITWSVVSGTLPAGITGPTPDLDGATPKPTASLNGTPTALGTSTFTVKAVDAAGKTAQATLTIEVTPPAPPGTIPPLSPGLFAPVFAQMMAPNTSAPTGTPADLTKIRGYGFEIYQDAAHPLVWDFDFLNLGSGALQDQNADNNFIIRGASADQASAQIGLLTMLSAAMSSGGSGGGSGGSADPGLLDLLNASLDPDAPGFENAGRMYVDGWPCVQIHDTLYSEQADPNDPPLTTPTGTTVRTDTVYLDVWEEPVTFVEDPEIRDVALGGPDTATRLQIRSRVRVAEGGVLPTDDGTGEGTLATAGVYTGTSNRFYRVEIDKAGDIGTATLRWSEDNGSTLARVIADIPPGSTKIIVEDAAGLHPGDVILIRKDLGEETHRIASVFSNVITLQEATGAQLAAMPAAAHVPTFTTFAMADRPKVQRWNAVNVPLLPDPADSTVSGLINLSDGVQVQFGGHSLRKGDYWNFKTRYLAGDAATGIDPVTRIEALDFHRPHGVRHAYAPLALLLRDPAALHPARITTAEDRRQRVGNATTSTTSLGDTTVAGTTLMHTGGTLLSPAAQTSKFVVFLSGDLLVQTLPSSGTTLTIQVSFYNDSATDPSTSPDADKVLDRTLEVPLDRKEVGFDYPLMLSVNSSDLSSLSFLSTPAFTATSVHAFVKLSNTSCSVSLTNMQLLVLELKRSF